MVRKEWLSSHTPTRVLPTSGGGLGEGESTTELTDEG